MKKDRSRYYGHRFPPEIISYAVWVYHRFCLSFRDVEDLLAERGIIISYETIRRWCQKFGPDYARKLRTLPPARRKHQPSQTASGMLNEKRSDNLRHCVGPDPRALA